MLALVCALIYMVISRLSKLTQRPILQFIYNVLRSRQIKINTQQTYKNQHIFNLWGQITKKYIQNHTFSFCYAKRNVHTLNVLKGK